MSGKLLGALGVALMVALIAFGPSAVSHLTKDVETSDTTAEYYLEEQADNAEEQEQAQEDYYYDKALQYASESNPDAIPYDEASEHMNEYVTLYGFIKDVDKESAGGEPIFVDLGETYPNSNRVTGVIWPEYHSEFPDIEDYEGKCVYMEGTLYEYNGIANIELTDSFQIRAAE